MATSSKHAPKLNGNSESDMAHSPGHKKINLKGQFSEKTGDKNHPQDASAMNQMANSNKILRTESPQRRIITGAALGKTGQRSKAVKGV